MKCKIVFPTESIVMEYPQFLSLQDALYEARKFDGTIVCAQCFKLGVDAHKNIKRAAQESLIVDLLNPSALGPRSIFDHQSEVA